MSYSVITLLFFCFQSGINTLPMDAEPTCFSKFDFEEKLLEKVVRMDVTFERLKGDLYEKSADFEKAIKKFESEFQDMITKVNNSIVDMNLKIGHLENEANEKLADAVAEFGKTQTSMLAYYKEWEKTADAKLDGIRKDTEEEMAKIKELAVKQNVVFHVKDIAAQPTRDSVIKFFTRVTNTDNVYDMDTGYFTAPTAGTYWFAAQICTNKSKQLSPSLYIRGTLINRVYVYGGDHGDCSTVTTVAILDIGDTATLKAGPYMDSSLEWHSSNYHSYSFMGALIN